MSNKPEQKKKPFFSCCAAEEEKVETYVDLSQKKQLPVRSTPPIVPYVPVQTQTTVISTGHAPKVRFSYLAPGEQNKIHPSIYGQSIGRQ